MDNTQKPQDAPTAMPTDDQAVQAPMQDPVQTPSMEAPAPEPKAEEAPVMGGDTAGQTANEVPTAPAVEDPAKMQG